MDNQAPVISGEHACAYLGGISRVTLWRLETAGQIKAVNVGRRRMFLVKSLEDYIDRQLAAVN